MRRVLGDFMNVASAGLVRREAIQQWYEALEYAVLHEVVDTFQLQLTRPGGERLGVSYTIRDDGTILEDSKAGGLDFQNFLPGTAVTICLSYRQGAKNLAEVQAYLRGRGWTTNGSLIGGVVNRDRAYSQGGFGVFRGTLGDWK
jgi:Bacterial HORMA domain family 1